MTLRKKKKHWRVPLTRWEHPVCRCSLGAYKIEFANKTEDVTCIRCLEWLEEKKIEQAKKRAAEQDGQLPHSG